MLNSYTNNQILNKEHLKYLIKITFEKFFSIKIHLNIFLLNIKDKSTSQKRFVSFAGKDGKKSRTSFLVLECFSKL